MSWFKPETVLDKVFEGGLILKGISGALELLGGLFLLFVSPEQIQSFLNLITQREITEDPDSKIANFILHSTSHFNASNTHFLIAYLWIHAAIKLIAVIGILKNHLWAYPFSLVTLGMLMVYQTYSIIVKPSVGMVLLTIFDIFILWLIWREYGKAKVSLKPKNN